MKLSYPLLALCLAVAMLPACTGLQRGMAGASLVSTANPRVDIAVPDLPLRTAGRIIASVTTDESLGGVGVESWIAVYGANTAQSPMAIVAIAEAPNYYFWDSDLSRNFSVDKIPVVFDNQAYQSCTYIVDGAHDAFATLASSDNPDMLKFLARRFAMRSNFSESKITLEYREALPADISTVEDLTFYSREYLNAFEERAFRAFKVNALIVAPVSVTNGKLEGVRTRFLNTNFMGTLSRLDPADIG